MVKKMTEEELKEFANKWYLKGAGDQEILGPVDPSNFERRWSKGD